MKVILRAVACFGLLMSVGCASIVSKSQYPVTINSNPDGAIVTVQNEKGMDIQKATTPTTVTLSASAGFFNPANYTFKFEKEGYMSSSTLLNASMDPWYVGNIIFGGLIGAVVDPATGAMWKLDDTVFGNLSSDADYKQVEEAAEAEPLPDKSSEKAAQDTSNSAKQQLIELKELKDSGVITDEEYQEKRKPLVDQL